MLLVLVMVFMKMLSMFGTRDMGIFSGYPLKSFDMRITIWVCHVLINKCRGPLLLKSKSHILAT